MKIGMILERDFPTTPPDIRVEKEAQSLIRGEHPVDMLSLQITSKEKQDSHDGISIHRVPIPMHCIKDWDATSVARFFHSEQSPWIPAMDEFVCRNRIDALHVHDLPLVWPAGTVAKRRNIPLVFDMHETYPHLVRFMRPGSEENHGWDASEWAARYETDCLEMADRIIVTVDESKKRLLQRGIPESKVAVVMNTEKTDNMKARGLINRRQMDLDHRLIITYVGAFGEVRGLDDLISATDQVKSKIQNVHLLLVGGGYNQKELEAHARRRGIQDRITITGWVDFTHVPDYIHFSDICVIPHMKNDFTDTTIPHKLFQYMLMEKPVIVSDIAPLMRIVHECDCGLAYTAGDIDSLAASILELAGSEKKRAQFGQNGLKAAQTKYNWQNEEAVLLNLYDTIHRENRSHA